MSNNDEKEFRLRPRIPPAPTRQNETLVWPFAFKRLNALRTHEQKSVWFQIPAGHKAGDQIQEPALRHSRHVLAKRGAGTMAGSWPVCGA